MRILVKNLSEKTTRAELRDLFGEYGEIARVGLAKSKPGGYGLVEMKDDAEGERAITALSGVLLRERPLKVRKARMGSDRKISNDRTNS